ncbi:MAG: RluA family pseudouridine synthase [Rhodospirillaceae bacterium]|nr:RluA family pseudouridine synthase [Rhodospirillaceae bacterium]
MSMPPVDAPPTPLSATWPEDASVARLDKACATIFPDLSRSRLKALIEDGRVTVNGGTLTDPSAKVKPGQNLCVAPPPPVPADPLPEDIPLLIVYEDADLLVLNKPPGLVVHPAAGNLDGTLVNALLAHCGDGLSGIGGVKRPGIVHRIDKDTSGLMVVAKSDAAHIGLSAQFAAHSLDRAYTAVVWGYVTPESGDITGNIGRNPKDRKKMAVVKSGGKTALTHYRVLERFGRIATLVECRLATGRTHQIRVHFTEYDHTLVGDPLYGRTPRHGMKNFPDTVKGFIDQFPRQALHAHRIGFNHPISNNFLCFEAPLPTDMEMLIAAFRTAAKINT